MEGTAIKRIFNLLLLIGIVGCSTTKLPMVSSKLELVFKEHEKMYKKQGVWKHVQWKYKYDRNVIDSIFTQYSLHDSDEFYIITSTNELANYSLEIKSYDKNIHLKFFDGYENLSLLDNNIDMSYSGDFKYSVEGVAFYEFVKSRTQEELADCSKRSGMINSTMVLFTYYNKSAISVKRFETCDYAEYFNLERPKEEDWE